MKRLIKNAWVRVSE
ncbi:Protein of unknown function [Anaplasma phagocytophilum]|uniref:Uncharacterized protein n=1 Tax=Anaplasma phagocytophilum TaxID=948 RepID=A0A098GM86_ANAPH|nr:Protein of unknown function [Anaplasma phagocytophilum]